MRVKKRFLACAILAILLSLISHATFAYFTAEETVYNRIQMGKIDIQLNEYQNVNGQLKPSTNDMINVMPATVVSKVVSVTSLENDAYIRVKYEIILKDSEGKIMDLTPEQISKLVKLDLDDTNWKYVDGWWYYLNSVKGGEATKPLFTTVAFDPSMGNEFQKSTAVLNLIAQATQKANNGTDALTAAGWPAE